MADTRTKMAARVAGRHLHSKVVASQTAARTASMSKTAGEVRFIKDRGGDEKNWAYADVGPSERKMNVEFEFRPSKLKPLARCLRSALMALGHTQSAYHEFAKIKSAVVSPDGNLGGKGYIQEIRAMRRQFMNCSEALSALTDTLYDEINAPHWAMDNPVVDRQREDVKEIMDDVEDIRDNPEAAAEESEEGQFGKQARRKIAAREPRSREDLIGYMYCLWTALERDFNLTFEEIQGYSAAWLRRHTQRLAEQIRGIDFGQYTSEEVLEGCKKNAPAAYKELVRMSGMKLAQTAASRVVERSMGASNE